MLFSVASSICPLGGRGYLPLLVGPPNTEDMRLLLVKVPLGSYKHIQKLLERDLNLVHVKFNNALRKGVGKRLKNKLCAYLNCEFNFDHCQPLDPLHHL